MGAAILLSDLTSVGGALSHLAIVSWLVSWCFEPSQLKGITSGLNTNFILSPAYSFHKSSYHKSCFFFFLAYLYSAGTQYKDWKVGRKAVGKTGREVEKKAARWTTGRKEDKPKGRLESRKEG